MKNVVAVIMLLFVSILGAGCSTRYHIINESNPTLNLNEYKHIHVGWLDLDESKWKHYGYGSVGEWKKCINEMNVLGLQKFIKDFYSDKTVTGDASNTNVFPKSGDLYIKNTVTKFKGDGRIDAITIMIQFYDIKTKKELSNSTIQATAYGSHWPNMESLLNAEVYNIAYYIYDRFYK